MKLQTLQMQLEYVDVFENPNIRLEQYCTSPKVAAETLCYIEMNHKDISGKVVADLGCGGGILAIGASLLNASMCIGIDIDENALDLCKQNIDELECENIELVQADVVHSIGDLRLGHVVDIVIMNPPFGTKNNKGIDIQFLKSALLLAKTSVYSFHKATTMKGIIRKFKRWNVKMEIVSKISFNLPKTYKKHTKDSVDIEVNLLKTSILGENKLL